MNQLTELKQIVKEAKFEGKILTIWTKPMDTLGGMLTDNEFILRFDLDVLELWDSEFEHERISASRYKFLKIWTSKSYRNTAIEGYNRHIGGTALLSNYSYTSWVCLEGTWGTVLKEAAKNEDFIALYYTVFAYLKELPSNDVMQNSDIESSKYVLEEDKEKSLREVYENTLKYM